MPARSPDRRNLTPPQVAKRYGVSTAKVIKWIRRGELQALNLAHRGCTRPRYSIAPEVLSGVRAGARTVVPNDGEKKTPRLRSRKNEIKEYFPN